MSLTEFQNSKIELAKTILDIESVTLLRRIENFINEEKLNVGKRREFVRQEEKQIEIRNGIEDVKGIRTISAENFMIRLS